MSNILYWRKENSCKYLDDTELKIKGQDRRHRPSSMTKGLMGIKKNIRYNEME